MEKGFYHPSIGYWQTNSEPSEEVITTYPEGTIEVGLPPTLNHRYIDGNWVEVQPQVFIPKIVTMSRARLALLQQGLLSQVQAAIDSLPSPQKEAAQIEWDYSSEVHRNKPFVQSLGATLELTEEQLITRIPLLARLRRSAEKIVPRSIISGSGLTIPKPHLGIIAISALDQDV